MLTGGLASGTRKRCGRLKEPREDISAADCCRLNYLLYLSVTSAPLPLSAMVATMAWCSAS